MAVRQRARAAIPRWALAIGVAGIIPFLLGAGVMVAADEPLIRAWGFTALASWSACVLSAVGAVHWGVALREAPPPHRDLLVGAIGPLAAWVGLALGGAVAAFVLAAGFLFYQGWDQNRATAGALPAWYARLRLPLTGVAVTCLLIAAGLGV